MVSSSLTVISLITAFLNVILLIGGVVLIAMRRREQGRGAVLGISGCVVLLLGAVFSLLQGFLQSALVDVLGIGGAVGLSVLVSSIFHLIGVALLIGGVVARRDPPRPAGPQGWPQQQPPAAPWEQQQGWNQPPQQPPYPQQQPGWQNPPQPPFGQGPQA
ncbi:hypothetical protein MF672_029415 [Actinomadura sp. ATCC 31491]|uniref:Uncharacterized protein n=1 Tax=Actinomadura luzonensis TaxID=2805427 RepID=A0ABT0FZV4_9ACTN|nr:hypothetical protein [Actinomadura luzonensis]MCK2217884.1 hypothetical protein [Actinomadura luzonensis]